jgi:hypothetical protein
MMKVIVAFRNFVNAPKYIVIMLCKKLYLIISHASVNAVTTVLYILVHVIMPHFDKGLPLVIIPWLLVEIYGGMKVLNQLDLHYSVAFDSTAHFTSCT